MAARCMMNHRLGAARGPCRGGSGWPTPQASLLPVARRVPARAKTWALAGLAQASRDSVRPLQRGSASLAAPAVRKYIEQRTLVL